MNQNETISKEEAVKNREEIRSFLHTTTKAYIAIGNKLFWFKANKAYSLLGYTTLEEFTETEYGLKKSSVEDHINVARKYSRLEINPNTGLPFTVYFSECDEYSPCQLLAMLPLNEEQRVFISPSESVRNIKRRVKEIKDAKSVEKSASSEEVVDTALSDKSFAVETADDIGESEDGVDDLNDQDNIPIDEKSESYDMPNEKPNVFEVNGTTWEEIIAKESEIKNYLNKKNNRKYTISVIVTYLE